MVNGDKTAENSLSAEDQRTYQFTSDQIKSYMQQGQDVPQHLLDTMHTLNTKVAQAAATGQNLTGGQGQEQGPS